MAGRGGTEASSSSWGWGFPPHSPSPSPCSLSGSLSRLQSPSEGVVFFMPFGSNAAGADGLCASVITDKIFLLLVARSKCADVWV